MRNPHISLPSASCSIRTSGVLPHLVWSSNQCVLLPFTVEPMAAMTPRLIHFLCGISGILTQNPISQEPAGPGRIAQSMSIWHNLIHNIKQTHFSRSWWSVNDRPTRQTTLVLDDSAGAPTELCNIYIDWAVSTDAACFNQLTLWSRSGITWDWFVFFKKAASLNHISSLNKYKLSLMPNQ